MSTVRRILETAYEVLRDEGWTQGSLSNDEGRCLIGALGYGVARTGGGGRSIGKALALVHKAIGQDTLIPNWNDAPDRTADEVLDVVKNAIVEAPLFEEEA